MRSQPLGHGGTALPAQPLGLDLAAQRRDGCAGERGGARCSGAPEQCAEARGKLPNIILVDFHDRGDLFEVVDALNKVSANSEPFQAAPEPPAT